jgi:ABC-type multidrug transport system ATPase subunit
MLDDPPVLFMDEPTSGLDPHVAQEVHDLIRRLRDEGRTVVLTTHYMEEASGLCDRVAILNHGRIVQTGSPHRMMVEHGEQKVRVEVRDGERTRTVELPLVDAADELHNLLAEHQLVTIHSIEATLQQVFIKLTGGDGNR